MRPSNPNPELSIDQLIKLATEWASEAGNNEDTDISAVKVKVCLDVAQIKLTTAEHEIRTRQIELTREANLLSEKLLRSNEEASRQNEMNAESMNRATEELAKSTSSLKWATWALVIFTAVQALIALASYFKK